MLAGPEYVETPLPFPAAPRHWNLSRPVTVFSLNFELLQLFDTRHWTGTAQWRAIRSVPDPTSLRDAQVDAAPLRSGALVDVVVLSAEVELFDAIRDAVGERNPVWRARSAEESVDLLVTGRCGVLVVDLSTLSVKSDTFIEQIVAQFPDVVVCVAGRREDEPLLAALISEGHVYRFMHKPLSPRRAGMFLQAAIRHHCDRLDDLPPRDPMLNLVATLPRRFDPMKWLFVAVGVAFFVALLSAGFGNQAQAPAGQASPPVASALPNVTHDVSHAPQADPVLSSARAAFESGRYESPPGRNALDLYKAVLLAHPDNAEAHAGLDKTLDRILASARVALETGRTAEAQRLVDRVLAADPGRQGAVQLAQQMNPAPAVAPAPTVVAAPPTAATAAQPVTASPVVPATASVPTPIVAPAKPLPVPVAARPAPVMRRCKTADVRAGDGATRARAGSGTTRAHDFAAGPDHDARAATRRRTGDAAGAGHVPPDGGQARRRKPRPWWFDPTRSPRASSMPRRPRPSRASRSTVMPSRRYRSPATRRTAAPTHGRRRISLPTSRGAHSHRRAR